MSQHNNNSKSNRTSSQKYKQKSTATRSKPVSNRSNAEPKAKTNESWLRRVLGGVFSKSTVNATGRDVAGRSTTRKPKKRGFFAKSASRPGRGGTSRRKPHGQRYRNLAERCPQAIGMEINLPKASPDHATPLIIPKAQHKFSRRFISSASLKVLKKLHAAGYSAYLVGGGVRDVLLGKSPKDFDVATNAHPEQIKPLFQRCRIIGRRFRLVHVYFRGEVVEVSTFRAAITEENAAVKAESGLLQTDNVYGTVEEDAWRRDFTINALYYNIADDSLVDYTGGLKDLQQQTLRVIGDPEQRFHEDPVRMLRAIRMAAKLGFSLESQAEAALLKLSHLLVHVPEARLFDEIIKLLFHGHAQESYNLLNKWGFLKVLFPKATEVSAQLNDSRIISLIKQAVLTTDQRFAAQQSLNPGFLLSVLFWPLVIQELVVCCADKVKSTSQDANLGSQPDNNSSLLQISEDTWKDLVCRVITEKISLKIPRRLQDMVRAIWNLQWMLEKRSSNKVKTVLQARYFRAAVDFMDLRVHAGFNLKVQNDWWWQLREANATEIQQAIDSLPVTEDVRKRRRRRPKKRYYNGSK